ncbi:MAG TPA: hypothetical protein VMM84_11220 [Pyrinomonadaceae bacterium]|nr:hypothetical protein [Pyrinomonadaceae bacterium]
MNCERFAGLVTDLARHGIMEAQLREEALNHAHECERCGMRLNGELALTAKLRMLAERMNQMRASQELEERLKIAFRSREFLDTRQKVGVFRPWTTAAAAAVLIALGIVLASWRVAPVNEEGDQSSDTTKPVAAALSDDSIPEELAEKVMEKGELEAAATPPARQSPRKRRGKRNPAVETRRGSDDLDYREIEIATDFLPVNYGGPMNLQDGGQIVRVELPRAALLNFGLPVNMARVDERVKADVVIGADGLARAIRFVQ